jgi:hypothetical protein
MVGASGAWRLLGCQRQMHAVQLCSAAETNSCTVCLPVPFTRVKPLLCCSLSICW